MKIARPRISGPGAAAAIGAGLAAALFLMLPAQKMAGLSGAGGAVPVPTLFSLAMGSLAPLPLMIATLGFGWAAGLLAIVVGALTVAAIGFMPASAALLRVEHVDGLDIIVFLVSFGVPSWLLARIAATPVPQPIGPIDPSKPHKLVRPEEQLLGLLVTVAVAFGILSATISLAAQLYASGGLDAFVDTIATQVKSVIANKPDLPKGTNPHDLAKNIVRVAMPAIAAAQALMLLVNLWLAARIAQMSNLLPQPWPDVPRHLRVPRLLAPVFAVALGLSFAGGVVGLVALIVSAGIGAGFLLQGLAVLHTITRGKSYRTPALVILYLLLPWLVAFYGLIGLLDTAFAFRDRPKKPAAPRGQGPWGSPPANPK